MFVVQAIVPQKQFALFQLLASKGASITKYPRTGRPAKKMFRFSFVEGNIYLTWKGKMGNQGVDLGDVSRVILIPVNSFMYYIYDVNNRLFKKFHQFYLIFLSISRVIFNSCQQFYVLYI